MLYFRQRTLIVFAGLLWLFVGGLLFPQGIALLLRSLGQGAHDRPLINLMASWCGGAESALVVLILASSLVGYLKSKYVLAKSVKRMVGRVRSSSNPTHLKNMYSIPYCLLILAMIALGISMKHLGLANDIRGGIDLAVGTALINGALLYFRNATELEFEF